MEQVLFTPTGHRPYKVEVVGNAIRCTTGDSSAGGAGNVIFSREGRTVDQILNDALFFLRTKGPEGIRIGSTQEEPERDTFEFFLRAFSKVGRLGSFFSPILVEKGEAEYFEKEGERGLWIRAKEA